MTTNTPARDAAVSDETVAALRALLAKATKLPWRVFDGGSGLLAIMKGDRPKVYSSTYEKRWKEIVKWAGFDGTDVGKRYDQPNATLIVAAVNALPAILARMDQDAATIAGLRSWVIAFGAAWAVSYARDQGFADGEIDPRHYDILAECGARMDSFTSAALSDPRS